MGEGAGALSAVLFVKGHGSYPWAFHPHDLLSPQRLCFLEPSRWGVGFHTGVLGRRGRWVNNRMGAQRRGWGGGVSGPGWRCHGSCPSVFLAVVPSGSGMLWRLMRRVAWAEWLCLQLVSSVHVRQAAHPGSEWLPGYVPSGV